MPALLSCPFCGSEAIEMKQYCRNGFRIRCRNCCVRYEQKTLRNGLEWLEQVMVEHWNRRAYAMEGANLHPPTTQGMPPSTAAPVA